MEPIPPLPPPPIDPNALGITPGRKIKAFLWMVLSVLCLIALGTYLKTPEAVFTAALWVIAIGGFTLIGGQSAIDAVAKVTEGKIRAVPVESSRTTTTTEIVK